jgi:6-phosphogluconolactonase
MKLLITLTLIVSVPAMAALEDNAGQPAEWRVYIGTYTGGKSEGIYQLRLNATTGEIENKGLAVAVDNPSFLALHPSKPVIYSVGQVAGSDGVRKGMVCAFAIQPGNGTLTPLNRQSTVGEGPCHVAVDRAGRHVLVANYSSGSVAALPLDTDGRILEASSFIQHEGSSVHPRRQQQAYAHAVTLDAAGRFVFAADLGIDKIMIYRFDDTKGILEPNDPPCAKLAPGAGPRHFSFHPTGRFAFAVNELDNTVTAFNYDSDKGRLETIQTIGTLPEDFKNENTTAEIRVHPSGRFLYASNRGHDSIACFAVDLETGRMTSLGQTSTQGKEPRNFNLTPDGRFLLAANQNSNSVVVFRIDPDHGTLEVTGHQVEVPTPVCVLFHVP